MIKKALALIFCAVFLLTASCSGEKVELLDFIDKTSLTSVDLEGKTFSFASGWYSEWYAFHDDTLPTDSVERMMNRFHSIEDTFNAKFEMLEISPDELLRVMIAGKDFPEMLDLEGIKAYDFYKSNALTPIDGLSTIEMNDIKWGTTNFIKYGNFNERQYGFYPWHWEFIPQFDGAVIFNGEIIENFGGNHPYELQERGEWNWDSFEAELKKYTTVNNEIQYYGAIVSTDKMAKAAIHSNGGNIIKGTKESGYSFGLLNDEAVSAMEWVKDLNTAGYLNTDGSIELFSKSQIAPYWVGESYFGTVFNPNDANNNNFIPASLNDYGFIPFPTGPNGDETDVGCYVHMNRRLNYISEIADIEPDYIGVIIDHIFEPLDDSSEEGWKYLAQSMVFTEENNQKCIDNFIYILENVEYDFSVQMGDSTHSKLNESLKRIANGSVSVQEAISSTEPAIMAALDE